MSHSTHTEEKPNIPSSAALWSVVIFIGLVLATINFVKSFSAADAHGAHATHDTHGAAPAQGHDAAPHTDAHEHGTTTPNTTEHAAPQEGHSEAAH
jgi:hypothetical protein